MKTILVAVDFSEASFNALSYAAYLANAFNSTLVVVHAYTGTEAIDDIPIDEVLKTSEDIEKANLQYLQAQMYGIIRRYTVKIKGIVRKGRPVQVIKKIAKEEQASLIVMGTKGKGKSNSIFGSTTVSMIGKAELPMIVVPEKAKYQPLKNIAVAIDFKDSTPVSDYPILNELIHRYDPFIRILNIQKKGSELSADFVSDKLRSGLIWSKYNHDFHIIENDHVEKGIDSFLKKNPSDLIAMVARKHDLVDRAFGHSHTKSMSKQTQTPLLVLYSSKENKPGKNLTEGENLIANTEVFGELPEKESIEFLQSSFYGRIGCHAFGKTYIVPISYAYNKRVLYFHTKEGMKIQMMRKNPEVCFQIDTFDGLANWKSVILHGTFKELEGKDKEEALKILLDRKVPAIVSETMRLAPDWPFTNKNLSKIPGIAFKIDIKEITGRFESPHVQTN